jgi:tight adherence protein B
VGDDGPSQLEQIEEEAVASIIRDQAADAVSGYLGEYGERMQTMISAAGSDLTVSALATQMAIGAFVVGLLMLFVAGIPGVLLAPVGAFLPYMLVQRQAQERAASLLTQMPDALELMARTMQTGTGLSEAFKLVSEEMPEPIAVEFGRVYEEIRFGKEWRTTLNDLVDRNPTIFDLRLFVSTMLLQRDTGGNMIETLSSISKTIRNRYVFDAKVRAMTSEARASGLVLALMPLGVIGLLVVASPDYISPMYSTSLGQAAVLFSACLYGFGLYMMKIASQVEA